MWRYPVVKLGKGYFLLSFNDPITGLEMISLLTPVRWSAQTLLPLEYLWSIGEKLTIWVSFLSVLKMYVN